MTQADGFILHSVTAEDGDMEGIPVALMEAMAQGLPVVTTRHSGIPELVEHEVTGFLVEERNEAALAKILGDIGTQRPDLSKLVEAARMTVKRDFNRTIQTQRLYRVFETILGARLQPICEVMRPSTAYDWDGKGSRASGGSRPG